MCATPDSLERYREYLKKLAEKKDSELFSNGGKEHATILYGVLFDNTCYSVRIYCESANSVIWNDPEFSSAFKRLVSSRNPEIRIMVENKPCEGNPFPEYLSRFVESNDKIMIRQITADDKSAIENSYANDNLNFAVFDDDKFRFEYDKRNYKAYGSFNDISLAKPLMDKFDDAFDRATQFDVV